MLKLFSLFLVPGILHLRSGFTLDQILVISGFHDMHQVEFGFEFLGQAKPVFKSQVGILGKVAAHQDAFEQGYSAIV